MKGKGLLLGLGFFILWSICGAAYGQTVSGTVLDGQTNEPLPGVNILIKGTTQGATTNAQGKYSLSVSSLQDTLVFSFVGYKTQIVPMGGRTTINIQMEPKAVVGEELVVTGYMTQRAENISGSVSVVSSETIEKTYGATTVGKALQGVIPGLHVSTNGSPSGEASLQIRGLTSITHSAHPLIVIDGVPSYSMNLRDINSNNIASIQVLKGAAAASIYGSQASGGVILIQTKKGQSGKLQVSYHGTFGVAKVMDPPNLMNTQQYGRALWWAAVNSGVPPNDVSGVYSYEWNHNYEKPKLQNVTHVKWLNKETQMPAANTDWMAAILRPGLQHNHQINISGGTNRATVFFSLNYFKNEGTQIHTRWKRYSVRLNSSYQILNGHVTIGENLAVSHMLNNDQNEMHQAMAMPSVVPVYTNDGGWGGTATNRGMGDYWNPVRILTLNKGNGTKYNKLIGNIYAKIDFLNHFTFDSKLGLFYTMSNHRTIDFKFQEGGGKLQTYNAVDNRFWKQMRLVFSNTLTYSTSVQKHNIDVLAGIESNQYYSSEFSANRRGLKFQNYDYAYLDAATGEMSVSGGGSISRLLSYFTKINYNYNSTYLFSASLRYDGSSKFGKNNQFGLFPAISVGWRISEEEFFKDNSVISNLKLRAGWGMLGNSQIPATATLTYFRADYNATAYAISGAETGLLPSGFFRVHTGNPNLKWESTSELNIGLDFGLLGNKLTGSLDWYRKETSGMLFNPPYLGAIGEGGGRWINAADMYNQGFEIVLKYRGNVGNEFTYSIRANLAHNHNEVTDLPVAVRYAYGGNGRDDDIIGLPLHSYYGYVAMGLFKSEEEVKNAPTQEAGKNYVGGLRFKDLNGDGVVGPVHDRKWLGTSNPTVEYGVGFSANYKNFDFYMFWQGVAGNVVYNGWKTYSDFWNVWVQNGFNHPVRILNAYNWQNTNSNIPALRMTDVNDQIRMSTYLLEPGGYLKLRQIELGYTLPASITANIGVQKIHIYVMAENIVSLKSPDFHGPDPEMHTGGAYFSPYLRPQTFKVGLDIKF